MLSEKALREALRRLGLEAPVRYDDVTGSTQATALALAEGGAPEWTLVAAAHQTAGRGRLGRGWESEPGQALLFSVVLRPELPPERVPLLTLLAGAAMARACREAAGVDVGCKWPNDLMAGEGKAGGVLAEAMVTGGRVQHVVLGIGLNVTGAPRDVPGAVALGRGDPAEVLSVFLRVFRDWYRPGDPAFPSQCLAHYRPDCVTLGRRVRATTVEGGAVEGRAVDLDERGGLVVDTDRGLELVAFGEVVHLEG